MASTLALSVYCEASTPDTLYLYSLLYSATDTSQESLNSGGELEPYLYEPVSSSETSNNTPEDDDVLRTMTDF